MTQDNQAANRFLEDIKSTLSATAARDDRPVTAHVTINRAVRCTIIVGQPPEPTPTSPRRSAPRKA